MTPPRELTLQFLAEPADVNFGGKVHGGMVMKWIDQAGYACAAGWCSGYAVTVYVGGDPLPAAHPDRPACGSTRPGDPHRHHQHAPGGGCLQSPSSGPAAPQDHPLHHHLRRHGRDGHANQGAPVATCLGRRSELAAIRQKTDGPARGDRQGDASAPLNPSSPVIQGRSLSGCGSV